MHTAFAYVSEAYEWCSPYIVDLLNRCQQNVLENLWEAVVGVVPLSNVVLQNVMNKAVIVTGGIFPGFLQDFPGFAQDFHRIFLRLS